MEDYLRRIKFKGELKDIFRDVCREYKIGNYKRFSVVRVGYEDLNIVLTTSKGRYFIKIFSDFRDSAECKRYIGVICKMIEAGVKHPKLFKCRKGYLYINSGIRLCVMEYIDGKNLLQSKAKLSQKEKIFIIRQITLINALKIKPQYVYDSWAISNFLQEYKKKRKFIDIEYKKIIDNVAKSFAQFNHAKLPHSFVHGDIIATNVIKDKGGHMHIIDFAVSNYYPRIQELAVLFCNLLFDYDNFDNFDKDYNLALKEYQNKIILTKEELKALPIYVVVAHAMHVINTVYEKSKNGYNSKENAYWEKLGKAGLKFTYKAWILQNKED